MKKILKRGPAAGHHVGLPNFLHAGVDGRLEVHNDAVHDDGEGREIDAVAAKRSEARANSRSGHRPGRDTLEVVHNERLQLL
jgi:hypothetical protein